MVGTPAKSVMASRSMISKADFGSKRGNNEKLPPAAMVAFWMQVCPNEWKRGSVASALSSLRSSSTSLGTTNAQLRKRLLWLSSAPFGCPVVPDV